MSPAAIIERATTEGVSLALTPAGTLKVAGDKAVVDRWVPEIRAHKPQIVVALQEAANVASSWLWLIRYSDRNPLEVACSPPATHTEILGRHPDAIAAEPFTPTIRQPSAPVTADEEAAIRAWLAHIGETDPATIAEVLHQCERDADARDYFTGRALGLRNPDPLPADRRTGDPCTGGMVKRATGQGVPSAPAFQTLAVFTT